MSFPPPFAPSVQPGARRSARCFDATRHPATPFAAALLALLFAAAPDPTAAGPAPTAVAPDEPEPAPAVAELTGLQASVDSALAARDYQRAGDAALRLLERIEPLHVETLHQLACIAALRGEMAEAYSWLDRAVGAGYWDAGSLRAEEVFAPLRQEERFRSVVRAAWANGYIAMLERPEREAFQKREQILATLACQPGERVADIGCGSGYFTVPVARACGESGSVLAIDASQEMLDYLGKRIEAEKLRNVRLQKVPRDDPQLPAGGIDTILMVDTIHYIQDRTAYARKLKAGLAPGGRLVIIDYTPKPFEERPWGPPPEQQVPRETMDAELAAAGFRLARAYDFLPEQYFVIYQVAD